MIKKIHNLLFRNMSIGTEIASCIALAVVIPLVILGAVFSKPLYNMVIAMTILEEQNALSKIVPQIDVRVENISDCMREITSDPFYEEIFLDEIDDSVFELMNSQGADDFSARIEDIKANSPINEIKIYIKAPEESVFFQSTPLSDVIRPEREILGTYWHGIFNGTRYADLYCPRFYLSNSEINKYGNSAYIIRTSIYCNSEVYPAYVALYYDNDIYGQILQDATTTNGSVSYIINDREALIVTTDSALSGTYRIEYDDIKQSLLASNSFVERDVAGVSVYVAFFQIEEADWFMVNVIPKRLVTDIAHGLMLRIIVIFVASFLIALIIALFLSGSITKRIESVSAQMKKVHNGPPVAMEESDYNDEIGDLIKTYNYMTRQMNQLIQKQEETAEELRFAEFNALQAQINPHFLYNTMDMINWMSLQGRNKEVSEVVQNLSKFYKLTLSRKKEYSTIADELEHAQVYIELQNMRFNDAIDFVIDVPDELCDYRLPKLTLQPILENSIFHGILEKESKSGTIVLTVWSEENDIHILISDDGVGMDESVRNQILSEERIRPNNSNGTNVAVVNIHRRLQLLYGDKYGLSYSSEKGAGCDVNILVPKHIGPESYVKSNK